ncbi:MAG TPA: DUF2795 domain-containing protein [Pseudonocardiaceae bacterium]
MDKPNPIQLQKFLGGIDYPASTSELVEHARNSGADEAVLRGLEQLPDRSFDGPNAVSQAYSEAG